MHEDNAGEFKRQTWQWKLLRSSFLSGRMVNEALEKLFGDVLMYMESRLLWWWLYYVCSTYREKVALSRPDEMKQWKSIMFNLFCNFLLTITRVAKFKKRENHTPCFSSFDPAYHPFQLDTWKQIEATFTVNIY